MTSFAASGEVPILKSHLKQWLSLMWCHDCYLLMDEWQVDLHTVLNCDDDYINIMCGVSGRGVHVENTWGGGFRHLFWISGNVVINLSLFWQKDCTACTTTILQLSHQGGTGKMRTCGPPTGKMWTIKCRASPQFYPWSDTDTLRIRLLKR